jgi:small GTP-binding protein
MTYLKGTLDTISLIQRLYSQLKRKQQLHRLPSFLYEIETKANYLLINNEKKKENDNLEKRDGVFSPNYWRGVAETTKNIKILVLKDPKNIQQSLVEMEEQVTEQMKKSGYDKQENGEIIPLIQQIIKGGKISVLGLDRAGKTTILQRMKTGRWIPNTTPTIGMNSETIVIGEVRFTAWDLGGQLQFRRTLWDMYTKNSVGLIFVVDLSDPTRYPEVRINLKRILSMTHLENLPLAIFANKIDLIEEINENDLLNILGISKISNREIKVFKTSAKTGEGIMEGIYWLSDIIMLRTTMDKDPSPATPYIYNPPPPPEEKTKAIEKAKIVPATIELSNKSVQSSETNSSSSQPLIKRILDEK